jgi:hypothetical protein
MGAFEENKSQKCTKEQKVYLKNKFNVTKMINFLQTSCKMEENEVQYIMYGKAFLFRQ